MKKVKEKIEEVVEKITKKTVVEKPVEESVPPPDVTAPVVHNNWCENPHK